MSPATAAIPSAVTGGNVAVYVRMKPGYTLTVPVMQGGIRKHLGTAVSALSEAGKGKKRGAISSIADTVADVTKKLEGIPIIGSYASMATSVVETAGNIAAFFGFSRSST